MSINPLSSNLTGLFATEPVKEKSTGFTETGSFADVLSETLNTAEQTDLADKASSLELLTGESDDMSGLLLDAQKAEIALQLTLQIRNKVVEAYNTLTQMQV